METAAAPRPLITRRQMILGTALAVPAFTLVAYGARTGRIPLLAPDLPEEGDLPAVPGVERAGKQVPGIRRAAFHEGVTLLNIWASWCPYCKAEREQLMRLSELPSIALFGLGADDIDMNARASLASLGNPFSRYSLDHDRIYLRALRQRGVPSTFIFAPDGRFIEKIPGAMSPATVTASVLPAIERAMRPA